MIAVDVLERMERFAGPHVSLRRAEPEDLQVVTKLYLDAMLEEEGIVPTDEIIDRALLVCGEWLDSPQHTVVLAEAGDEVLGECVYRIYARDITGRTVCEISGVYVRPKHRESGTAVAILGRVAEIAREIGVDQMVFQASPGKHQSFYERLGARAVSTWYQVEMR